MVVISIFLKVFGGGSILSTRFMISFSKITILLVGSAFDLLLLELPLIHSTKGSCIRVFNTLFGRNNNLIMFKQAHSFY